MAEAQVSSAHVCISFAFVFVNCSQFHSFPHSCLSIAAYRLSPVFGFVSIALYIGDVDIATASSPLPSALILLLILPTDVSTANITQMLISVDDFVLVFPSLEHSSWKQPQGPLLHPCSQLCRNAKRSARGPGRFRVSTSGSLEDWKFLSLS